MELDESVSPLAIFLLGEEESEGVVVDKLPAEAPFVMVVVEELLLLEEVDDK